MLFDVTPGADALGAVALGVELQAANTVADNVMPMTLVTTTRVHLPMELPLLCLIAAPFVVACSLVPIAHASCDRESGRLSSGRGGTRGAMECDPDR